MTANEWSRPLALNVSRHSRDPQNFVDPGLFTFELNREMHKAARLRYSLSVLCFTPDVPPANATRVFTHRLTKLSIGQIRATDLAAILDPSCLTILLIDAEPQNLPRVLHRVKEGLGAFPGLTLSAGGACYPQTAASANELLRQANEMMIRAKTEGGNRLNLPS